MQIRNLFSTFAATLAVAISFILPSTDLDAWQTEGTDEQQNEQQEESTPPDQWVITLQPEGMESIEAVLEIQTDSDDKLTGTIGVMGDKLPLSGVEFKKKDDAEDSGNLTFQLVIPSDVELDFDLTIEGLKISGDVVASDGVTGTVKGKKKVKQVERWEIAIEPEGMDRIEATLEIVTTPNGKRTGTLEIMGHSLELSDIEREAKSGKLDFQTTVPDEEIDLEFELIVSEDEISGDVAASDGVTGTIEGKKESPKEKEKTTDEKTVDR